MFFQKNDLATDSFVSAFYKKVSCCRNPFSLDAEDIKEEENYFTCPFHRSKIDE